MTASPYRTERPTPAAETARRHLGRDCRLARKDGGAADRLHGIRSANHLASLVLPRSTSIVRGVQVDRSTIVGCLWRRVWPPAVASARRNPVDPSRVHARPELCRVAATALSEIHPMSLL